eukprot:m.221832 g.221832  ORF g.221832 m.221832 type:complete len:481 (-) comp10811_c4_seq1:386-1828(-)
MDVTLHPKAHLLASGRVVSCARASVLVRAKPYALRLVMLLKFSVDADAAAQPLVFRFPLHSNLQMQSISVFGVEMCAPTFLVSDGFCQVTDMVARAPRSDAADITVVVTVDQIPSERHTCAAWIPLGNPILPCNITFQLDATELSTAAWSHLLIKLFYPHTRHRLCTFRGTYVAENEGVILRRRALTLSEYANLKILVKFNDPGFSLSQAPGHRPYFAHLNHQRWLALTSNHDDERERRLPPSVVVGGGTNGAAVPEARSTWTWRLIDRSRQQSCAQSHTGSSRDSADSSTSASSGRASMSPTSSSCASATSDRRISEASDSDQCASAAFSALSVAPPTDDEILTFSILTLVERPRPEESIMQGEDRDALLSLLSIVRSRTQDRNDFLADSPVFIISQLFHDLRQRPQVDAADGFVWEDTPAARQLEQTFRVVASLPIAAADGFESFSLLFPELQYFAEHHIQRDNLLALTNHPVPPPAE